VRWFVAIYDYNPTTMSPNPDACEEELPFSEGDTIKVLKLIPVHEIYYSLSLRSNTIDIIIFDSDYKDINCNSPFRRNVVLFREIN
jgi:hypothetical protein